MSEPLRQARTLDQYYPGHNKGPSFWEFFFPGVYEGWQSWLKDPAKRPVDSASRALGDRAMD